VSGVSRWLTGVTGQPKAQMVISFARGLNQRPIEALVAAGYLEPEEVKGAVEVMRSPSDMSNDELLTELADRLSRVPDDEQTDRLGSLLMPRQD